MSRYLFCSSAWRWPYCRCRHSPLISPGLFKSKPPAVEDERQETLAQIREAQDQLMLLQYKLRTLDKRKAKEEAAAQHGKGSQAQSGAGESNWQEVDQQHLKPSVAGVYTYLLYDGGEIGAAARATWKT